MSWGAAEGQLQVELIAWPLRQLEAWRASVGEWADALAGVDAIDSEGEPLQVNLLPPAQRQLRADPMRRWNVLLAVAALVMLVLAPCSCSTTAVTLPMRCVRRSSAVHAVRVVSPANARSCRR